MDSEQNNVHLMHDFECTCHNEGWSMIRNIKTGLYDGIAIRVNTDFFKGRNVQLLLKVNTRELDLNQFNAETGLMVPPSCKTGEVHLIEYVSDLNKEATIRAVALEADVLDLIQILYYATPMGQLELPMSGGVHFVEGED